MNEQYDSTVDFINSLPADINSVAICGTSYTDTGGVARVIEQQAIELSESGYDVEIDTFIENKNAPDGVTLHAIGRFETTPYKEINKLLFPLTPGGWQFLSRMENIDLIITHRFPFSILSYLAAKKHGTTYVFWSHPSQSSANLFDGVAKVWATLQHHMETENLTVRGADYICAVSQESRSYIESQTGRDAIYVPNTVPDSRFTEIASTEKIERRYDIDPADRVVLHVGRITPRKSIDKLIESFETVTADEERCKLVLVGKENMDDYSATVRDQAGENVIFTGFVDDEILAGFYDRSDLYATCSLSEGWGLPLSEASRFDTTIVAYDSIPAVRSIENTVLARNDDQDDFESKLADALNACGTDREIINPTDTNTSDASIN